MKEFQQGDVVRFDVGFSRSGEAIDPDTVAFKVKDPSGNTTTYDFGVAPGLIRSTTGVYYIEIAADEPGVYSWRWESTGGNAAAEQGKFVVAPTLVP